MKLVYKYCPPSRKSFFSHPKFRFTYPSDLNDPLECYPILRIKDINKVISDTVERNRKLIEDKLSPIALQKAIENYSNDLKNNEQAFINRCLGIHMKHVNQNVGILSLTKENSIELLWAHYCQDHKGFVIGLNSESDFFKKKNTDRPDIGQLIDVRYEPDILEVNIDQYSLPMEILYTKKDIWAYEKEARIIRELKNCDEKITKDGKDIHLFNFPKKDVAEVIFGLKMDIEDIDQIKSIIKSDPTYNVNLKKASFNSDGKFIIQDYA